MKNMNKSKLQTSLLIVMAAALAAAGCDRTVEQRVTEEIRNNSCTTVADGPELEGCRAAVDTVYSFAKVQLLTGTVDRPGLFDAGVSWCSSTYADRGEQLFGCYIGVSEGMVYSERLSALFGPGSSRVGEPARIGDERTAACVTSGDPDDLDTIESCLGAHGMSPAEMERFIGALTSTHSELVAQGEAAAAETATLQAEIAATRARIAAEYARRDRANASVADLTAAETATANSRSARDASNAERVRLENRERALPGMIATANANASRLDSEAASLRNQATTLQILLAASLVSADNAERSARTARANASTAESNADTAESRARVAERDRDIAREDYERRHRPTPPDPTPGNPTPPNPTPGNPGDGDDEGSVGGGWGSGSGSHHDEDEGGFGSSGHGSGFSGSHHDEDEGGFGSSGHGSGFSGSHHDEDEGGFGGLE